MIKKYLRILVCGLALQCNALPALANWDLAPATTGTVVHIFSANAGNVGTATCAGANVECPTTIPVNTAGSPLFVTGNAGLVTGTGGTFPVTGTVTSNAGTNLNTSLLALEGGGNLATLASAISGSRMQANVSQINGNTPLTGNGVTGTGSQRVTIASDNTAFSVNATLQASSATAIGTVNPTTAANWGLGATAAAVPANAHYIGINTGGNLVGWTGAVTNAGTFAVQLTGATNNINNIAGTVSLPTGAATSALQTTINTTLGSPFQAGASIGNTGFNALQGGAANAVGNPFFVSPGTGTTWVAVQSTAANLNMTCANCSGSGASGTDGGGFSPGASVFAPVGGFFQSTPTNNALSNATWGAWQMTTNRAGFVNLRNNAGTEVGTSGAPLRVDPTGTTTQPVSIAGNQAVNVAQINGVTPLMGNGVTGTGSQRVTIASDNTAFSVNATLQASSATAIGTVNPTTAANWGVGTSTQNSTTVANGQLALAQFNTSPTTVTSGNMSPIQMDSAGNLLVNIKAGAASGAVAQGSTTSGQTGGLTQAATTTSAPTYTTGTTNPLSTDTAGNLRVVGTGLAIGSTTSGQTGSLVFGATTTGNPTYTTAQSNPLSLDVNGGVRIAGEGSAGTATGGVVTVQGVASMTPILANPGTAANWGVVTQGSTTSGQSGNLVQGAVTTASPTYTTAQTSPLSLDTSGSLRVAIVSGGGSGGTSSADKSAWTVSSTVGTQIQGEFTTGGATACATAQACTVGMTAARGLFTDASSVAGTATLTGNGTTGAGSQRVTIASDNTAFSVNATVSQATSSNLKGQVDPLTIASWGLMSGTVPGTAPTNTMIGGMIYNSSAPAPTTGQTLPLQSDANGNLKVIGQGLAQGSTTSGQAGSMVMGAVTTASPTYTTAQTSPLSLDTSGSLRVAIVSGAGSGGTAIADAGTFTAGTTSFTPTGGQFTSGGATACVTGHACWAAMTADRAMFSNMADWAGTALGAPSNYGTSPGAVAVPGVNAFVTNNVTVVGTGTLAVQSAPATATAWGIIADKGTFTASTSPAVLVGAQFTTGGATACATTQACALGMTAARGLFTDLSSVGATTVLTGTGAVGAGSQRVAVGTDTATIAGSAPGTAGTASTNVLSVQGIASMTPLLANPGTAANWGVVATGAAPPANAVYEGALGSGATGGLVRAQINCDQHAFVDNTTQLQTIVAGVTGRKTYLCGFLLATGGTATNISLTSGTGTNCVTTSVAITPAYQLVANDRAGFNSPFWNGLITLATADNLCVSKNAANSGQIEVWYAII